MENFAKKLAAGLITVPSRLSWWPRHSRAMLRYLHTGHDSPNSMENIRKMVGMGASEWDSGIPGASKKGLMGHHVALEMCLVEASRDKDAVKIGKIGTLLQENAEEMAASFGSSIMEFPETQFAHLLMEHVASYAEIVRLGMEGSVKKAGDRMERNTLSLAAFTTEWF